MNLGLKNRLALYQRSGSPRASHTSHFTPHEFVSASDVDLLYAIGLPPEKAIEYFKNKGYAFSWSWRDLWQEAQARAFTVAKAMRLDVLQTIRDEVQKALDEGLTFADFQKDLEPKLKALGWWGKEEHIDTTTGEVTQAQLGSPYRLQTIYRTNLQTSYMAGRYRDFMENVDARPYWQYVAVMDSKTRPTHAALNGLVFRYDDPFWDTHYPPNDWNCRCRVRALSDRDIVKRGLDVSTGEGHLTNETVMSRGKPVDVTVYSAGNIRMAPGPGWNYNPGAVDWKPDLNRYDPDIRKLA